jgi:hypothetical protein
MNGRNAFGLISLSMLYEGVLPVARHDMLVNWTTLCAVERMVEYRSESEEAAAVVHPRPPGSWPHAGAIQAVQLVVKYRSASPSIAWLSCPLHVDGCKYLCSAPQN